MVDVLEDCKLVLHHLMSDLVIVHSIFADNFDRNHHIRRLVHCNSDVRKVSLAYDAAEFVSLFDIFDVLKSLEIFEA